MNVKTARTIKPARFPQTFCSQCGRNFGPGNSGYSHCKDHKDISHVVVSEMLERLTAKHSVDPGIYRFAEKLVVGSGNGPINNDAAYADWRDAQAQDLAEQIQQVYDDWLAVD